MLWTLVTLALATDVRVPVAGEVLSADGIGLEGTHNVTFSLIRPNDSVAWTEAQPVVFAAGGFAAALVLVTGGAVLGRVTGGSGVTDATRAGLGAAMARLDEAPMSIASATALLDRAQQDYQRAALWLAANDSVSQSSEVYRARLAALDDMMAASRAALREAPQDPLLNHYFLSAWAAREATLQQLGAALPVDKLVERY